MKKIILLLIILCRTVSAQTENFIDFLPLQVGNIWVYQCTQSGQPPTCGYCTKRIRVNITTTSIINGKTYYQGQVTTIHISGSCPGCNSNILNFSSYIRVDSATANVLEYSTNSGCPYRPNEILHDSLKARLYDSIRYNCQPPSQWNAYVCRDTNNIIIFGQSRQHRRYSFQGFESGGSRSYVKGIGLTSSGSIVPFCNNQSQLLGCVIGGVVYGDTGFMVGVNEISAELPESFSLFQNYPNPFNPATKIQFSIPPLKGDRGRIITLIIYDILGREIQTLVNEQLQPGTYEVEWDGSSYASGVYYYTLSADEFTQTKRMVLIK